MKLITTRRVKIYRIQANYKKREPNAVLTAVLIAAQECGGTLTAKQAHERLSGAALNERTWTNLLVRLAAQGYFEQDRKSFVLTELGAHAATQQSFYKSLRGVLEIWLLAEPIGWLPHRVVRIAELDSRQKDAGEAEPYREGALPTHEDLQLQGDTFRLEHIEPQTRYLSSESLPLEVVFHDSNAVASVGQLQATLCRSEAAFRDEQLKARFEVDYDESNRTLRLPFTGATRFKGSRRIEAPNIEEVVFEPLEIESIQLNARTYDDAQQWRLAFLQEKLTDYLFDSAQYRDWQHEINSHLAVYHELEDLPLSEFEQLLQPEFYRVVKIRAPRTLSY